MEGCITIEPTASEASRFDLATPAIRIAPSLLSADFARLERDVSSIESAGATMLHLDVMDGHFVPNISFGAGVIASLRKCTKLFFDAHLMIAEPKRYAEAFVKAGCDHITFHIETAPEPQAERNPDLSGACAKLPGALDVVEHIRSLGVSVGVALNPTTPVSAIESIIDSVDLVLVMSVWPGFSGQKFIADVLPKVAALKGRLSDRQRLQIDGGVDVKTIGDAARAGADTFVAGSAIFGQPNPPQAMKELQRLATEAAAESGMD